MNFHKNITNYINKYIITENIPLVGRWCHKGIPKCNDSVIERKIDFALLDNSMCFKENDKYGKKVIKI